MQSLFEKQDSLNAPIETFIYDTGINPYPVKPHWHYFAEFIYVLEGSALVTCDDTEYTVSEKELLLLTPMSVHSLIFSKDHPMKFAGIKFDTARFPNSTTYAPSVSNIFKYARELGMHMLFNADEAEKLNCSEIFADCISETDNFMYGRDVILRAQIYRLIFGVVRNWMAAGLDINGCPVNSSDLYGIENIAEYIDSCLEDNIRVSDIAAMCNMSYSGFAAKFHEQYGMSCKEYIERMRIFKAEEYLMFTDYDLTSISQKTGFSDCSHFIRSFKKFRGLTPKQFRMHKMKPD